jgi:hypothetical protein
MSLPRVFVGSSREGLPAARAIQTQLSDAAEVRIWNEGVFGLNQGNLESLVRMLGEFDVAVLVLTPDDVLISRNEEKNTARDNVLLELGLFMGRLGRDRTLAICRRGVNLPSDLAGVTVESFDDSGDPERLVSALGPACNRIRPALSACAAKIARRENFLSFFGRSSLTAPYSAVFLDAQLPRIDGSDLCVMQLGKPPKDVLTHDPVPRPKGIHQIVPYKELEVILRLDRLFREFGGAVEIRLDDFHEGGSDLPSTGCLAIGLGFNNATLELSRVSGLYQVLYENGTDDFCILPSSGEPVRPAVRTGEEYALLARVLMLRGNGKPTPYLVCAGHTATGTVASCHYVADRWPEIWEQHQDLLENHHMAIVLAHPVGVRNGNQRIVGQPYFKPLAQNSFVAGQGQ